MNDVVHQEWFRTAVEKLRVPGMGTETVAPLLSTLVQLVRPRTVLEVGMGYTTPFLAAALAGVEEQVRAESLALAEKSRPYLAEGVDFEDRWLYAEPALLTPDFYVEPYRTRFVAIDNLSIPDSSAPRVRAVLEQLGLADRVTVVNADLRESIDLLPEDFAPIDLAWVDAWECLYFFDHFWDLINPAGGLVVMHYLMTYPEGEAIIDYIAKVQRARPGELEVVNLLEPHKLVQNSVTVLRRTSAGKHPGHADPGGALRYGALRENAATHLNSITDPD
ncbi:MAG TPA: class I SAM-dependent methyltransferase [Umezawaea sp.]|nr:class I SAM-dependent methyltransferase [Umezawaea sp.]